MSKEEFLRRLEEALAGEVPTAVIRDNLLYYQNYLSQETARGRTVDEIVTEIGEPRIIARTIIDSTEAMEEAEGADYERGTYQDPYRADYGSGSREDNAPQMHYFDLSKWYWKLLMFAGIFLVLFLVLGIVNGILALLIRFAGPIFFCILLYWLIKRRR